MIFGSLTIGDPKPKQDQQSTDQIRYTAGYSGFSNFNNNAEISNDITTSFGKALMLNGNSSRSLGGARWVQVWDNLEVIQELWVGVEGRAGSVTTNGTVKAQAFQTINAGDEKKDPRAPLHVGGASNPSLPCSSGIIVEANGSTGNSPRLVLIDTNGNDAQNKAYTVDTAPAWVVDNWGDNFRIYRQPNLTTAGPVGAIEIHQGAIWMSFPLNYNIGGTFYSLGIRYQSGTNWAYFDNPASDLRLKEDVRPIISALERVLQLQGIVFRWNDRAMDHFTADIPDHVSAGPSATPEEHQKVRDAEFKKRREALAGEKVGLIAQEVESVLPQLVYEDEAGYKHVRYEQVTALLVQAIKEQQAMIQELTRKVAALKGK